MPELKTRMLFISHAWQYDSHYITLEKWFNEEPNFSWKNCSVPSSDALPDKTKKGLEAGLTRQINPAQCVLILGGMWAAHSDWIKYEIEEAVRLSKVIIGIRPWGQERVPTLVQDNSDVMVNWNRSSIISEIRARV